MKTFYLGIYDKMHTDTLSFFSFVRAVKNKLFTSKTKKENHEKLISSTTSWGEDHLLIIMLMHLASPNIRIISSY